MSATLLASVSLSLSASGRPQELTSPAHTAARLDHARELLGSGYSKSRVKLTDKFSAINEFVLETVRARLPAAWRSQSREIAHAIQVASQRHGLDPVFVMAVIESESQFNPECRGAAGEIGLMQILPRTGAYIAQKTRLAWQGETSLANPVVNIHLGTAYFGYLRTKFERHSRLYIAAYNMGSTNVKRALSKRIWPKEYASKVMQNYLELYEDELPEFASRRQAQSGRAWRLETLDAFAALDDMALQAMF